MVDFKSLKSVIATPPAGAGRAASGESPLRDSIEVALKDGEWHGFLGVPNAVVGKKKSKKTGEEYDVTEWMTLVNELKRAGRQIDCGLEIRTAPNENGESTDVYFRAGEKRKYAPRTGKSEESNGEAPKDEKKPASASKK